nr:MAG TPA: hypothetical protein [Caudoviricetes sp.]
MQRKRAGCESIEYILKIVDCSTVIYAIDSKLVITQIN